MEFLSKVDKIILHHTKTTYDHPYFIKLRHKLLRWWDDIWYHFIIGNGIFSIDWKLYHWRDLLFQEAHVFRQNSDSIGISLIWDFDLYKPSLKQLDTLYTLLIKLIKEYNIAIENVLWHSDFNNEKSCPGKNLNLNIIRNELFQLLNDNIIKE